MTTPAPKRTTLTLTKKGTRAKVAATVGYPAATYKAVLNPSRALVRGATCAARITTGTRDLADSR